MRTVSTAAAAGLLVLAICLGMSGAAEARVFVTLGFGFPAAFAPPPPVYYAPTVSYYAPPVYYRYYRRHVYYRHAVRHRRLRHRRCACTCCPAK